MKTILRFFLRLFFRFEAYDTAALSAPGPVLLLANHVSWLDWLFLAVCLDDDWKFVTSSTTAKVSPLHRWIMINRYTFPVENDSPYAVKRMAEFLQHGGRMVLFPEGRLSQTGSLMKLFDGTGFLLYKTNARVITCHLRGASRLPFSPHPGWKKLFPRVTAHFSPLLTPPKPQNVSTTQARTRLTRWVRDRMVGQHFEVEMAFGARNLFQAVLDRAREQPGLRILEDFSRQPMTYRRLIAGADLLAGKLQSALPTASERIGVLLPNVSATPVLLLALWSIGKIPALLNFSTGPAIMLACLQLARVKHIVTSRTFLQRARLDVQSFIDAGVEIIYLDDLGARISSFDKFLTLARISFLPQSSIRQAHPPETAAILFTSGSEGVPKGVELTHQNLLANIRQMLAVTDLQDNDRIFNCLPLFHSFGLSVGTLLGLVRGMPVFIYASPLHYRVVPTLFYDTNSTVFLSTNTFLSGYARKAHPYDFASLRYLFSAAEKLQEATAQIYSQRFGVRILEGYGATECSPCVSVNTPLEPKYGAVGRPLPGLECRLETVEGVEVGGRLFVRGPNVMRGYLNPDAQAKFAALDGWYDTGDIVRIDEEGYFHILGRLKRFAKVSGEMVSLTAVEDALAGAFPQYGLRCQVAVVTRPDADKGEALIAVTNEPKLQTSEIREAIKAKGLGNLCVPREIKVVREIPKLGTGKINHRELQKLLVD